MVLCAVPASAQFLNIQIDVDPEVETLVEQDLDFGQVVAGSGFQPIPPGSPSMGIFRIRALRTQRLLISLEADERWSTPIPLSATASRSSCRPATPRWVCAILS
jgi:hypothetical protein